MCGAGDYCFAAGAVVAVVAVGAETSAEGGVAEGSIVAVVGVEVGDGGTEE